VLECDCDRIHNHTHGPDGDISREKDAKEMPPLDILFRQVPEGFEFVAVLLTILGSLAIMVVLGAWWSR